jgi:L-alanine-DL-glutamate epimerase-like enolase superfamily enzyme
MSGGKVATHQDSTIVKLTTDEGLSGWGECCPFSPTYAPAHAEGARAALREIAPALLGCDPQQVEATYLRMNSVLAGHGYAKSAVDMACWDILGKSSGLALSDLLGGTLQRQFPIYAVVGLGEPEEMRRRSESIVAQGYRGAQIKVGSGNWRDDVLRVETCLKVLDSCYWISVDANAFLQQSDAAHIAASLAGSPIYFEQPCRTMAECAAIRPLSNLPFILDESLCDVEDIVRARETHAMDAAMLKLQRFGGVTRIRLARDLCQQIGFGVVIEDAGGGDIVSAAMVHLAASTWPTALMTGSLTNKNVNERIAEGAPDVVDGLTSVPAGPGLGITVDQAMLGEPLFSVQR